MSAFDKDTLKAWIDTYIRNNGIKSITGDQMNTILKDIVDSYGEQASITTETSERIVADTSLSTMISTETSDRTVSDLMLLELISSEISERVVADNSLSTLVGGGVAAEASIRAEADASLSTVISTETSERIDADNSLSTLVGGGVAVEASIRLLADQSLSTGISTETSDRIVVDILLNDAINNEILGRTSTDSSLSSILSSEISSRIQADGLLSSSIVTGDSLTLSTAKAYADAVASGVSPHAPVRVISTSNITLSGIQTIDGITLSNGNSVLVAGQIDKTKNGIYTVSSGGTWSRRTDADGDPSNEIELGDYVFVESGATMTATGWVIGKTDATGDIIRPDIDMQEWFIMASPTTYTASGVGINLVGTEFNISSEIASRTNSDNSLSNAILAEASLRLSGDTSLSMAISVVAYPSTPIQTIMSSGQVLYMSGTTLTGVTYVNSASDVTSLSTAISQYITGDTSSHQSLSTVISQHITGDTSSHQSLSTAISQANSLRLNGDLSVLSEVSGNLSSHQNTDWTVHNSLSTAISQANSLRLSADLSLSTAITQGGGGSSGATFSGGTVSYLNTTGDLSVGGYITKGRKISSAASNSAMKANYSGFPTGNRINISINDKAMVFNTQSNANFIIYYSNDTCDYKGNGQFTSNTGLLSIVNNRITKLSNGRVDMYDLVNGVVDTTTYSGYTTGNAKFVQNTTYDVDYIGNTNAYCARHKEIGNSTIIRDKNGKILRTYWDTGNTYTVDFLTIGGSFSTYMSGNTEVVRVITSGMTMNTYHNGVLQSSSGLTSNWIGAGHSTNYDNTAFVEENSKYIFFGYFLTGYPYYFYITTYDKALGTYTTSVTNTNQPKGGNTHNNEPTATNGDNVIFYFNDGTPFFYTVNKTTKAVTVTQITLAAGDYEADMQFWFDTLYYLGSGYGTETVKKYILATTSAIVMDDTLDSLQLAVKQDIAGPVAAISTTLSTAISNIPATVAQYILPWHVVTLNGVTTTSYVPFDEGYRLPLTAGYLQDINTGANINNINKLYSDIMMVGQNKLYFTEISSYSYCRNVNVSGVTKHDIIANTSTFIENIAFANITFNHRDKLISYKDVTNNKFKIYNCVNDTVIKEITNAGYTWVASVDSTKYWAKTTGTTIEIRNMTDDTLVKATTLTPTWYTYNLMYNPYNYTIYMWQSEVNSNSSCVNIWTGKGRTDLGAYSSAQGWYTENFIYIGTESSLGYIWIYDKFNNYLGKIPQYDGWNYSVISNGQYFVFKDASDGNKCKILY